MRYVKLTFRINTIEPVTFLMLPNKKISQLTLQLAFISILFVLLPIQYVFSGLENDRLDSLLHLTIDKQIKPNSFNGITDFSLEEKSLHKIITKKSKSYSDVLIITNYISKNKTFSVEDLSRFISLYVKTPNTLNTVQLDYVKIRWYEIGEYREGNKLTIAGDLQQSLSEYLNSIQVKNDDLKRARIYEKTHDIVLKIIQRDIKKGLELCETIEKSAKAIKDTSLIIQSINLKCEFLVFEGRLDEFITLSEESHRLDSIRSVKSEYYSSTIMHLIDAYIYEGNHPDRSLALLKRLHANPESRKDSYTFYAKYLSTIELNDPIKDTIFAIVGANNITEFYDTTFNLSKAALYPNDFYHFLRESANALENFGETAYALSAMEKANSQIKAIYSQDLSREIAQHENRLIEQEKNLEIKYAEKISNLYLMALIIILGLLLVLIIIIVRKTKQNKHLEEKNIIIQNKEKEKILLLKELHHRVKNNFQIISSLLSTQARNVDNEQMKAILTESQSRINSMALTHEKLYGNDDFRYNLKEYIESLHIEISDTFDLKPSDIKINVDDDIIIDMDMALPIGLIFNELITNSLKHGINDKNEVIIEVQFKLSNGSLLMSYSDSGPGIHNIEIFDNPNTMGLRLIKRLTRQLQGAVNYENQSFEFDVPFKH